MRSLFAVLPLLVVLVSCQTTQFSVQTQETLRDTCAALETAHDTYTTLRDGGIVKASVARKVDAAWAGVSAICGAAPPANATTAALRVAAALVTINAALASH